jgi:hypothetical protein
MRCDMNLASKAVGFEKMDFSSERRSAMGMMPSNTLMPTGELSKQRMISTMSIV